MIDLLSTKFLRVDVTLVSVRGITTNFKSNRAHSVGTLRDDISIYASFSSTGILGGKGKKKLMVTSNVIDDNGEIKSTVRWNNSVKIKNYKGEEEEEKEEQRDDVPEEQVVTADSKSTLLVKESDCVSIPIVLCEERKASQKTSSQSNTDSSNWSTEIVNIDFGLMSRNEQIQLGRASFVVSDDQIHDQLFALPVRTMIRNPNLEIDSRETSQHSRKRSVKRSILNRLKGSGKKSYSKLKGTSMPSSSPISAFFEDDGDREFKLSDTAVLEIKISVSSPNTENGILRNSRSFSSNKKENDESNSWTEDRNISKKTISASVEQLLHSVSESFSMGQTSFGSSIDKIRREAADLILLSRSESAHNLMKGSDAMAYGNNELGDIASFNPSLDEDTEIEDKDKLLILRILDGIGTCAGGTVTICNDLLCEEKDDELAIISLQDASLIRPVSTLEATDDGSSAMFTENDSSIPNQSNRKNIEYSKGSYADNEHFGTYNTDYGTTISVSTIDSSRKVDLGNQRFASGGIKIKKNYIEESREDVEPQTVDDGINLDAIISDIDSVEDPAFTYGNTTAKEKREDATGNPMIETYDSTTSNVEPTDDRYEMTNTNSKDEKVNEADGKPEEGFKSSFGKLISNMTSM